MDVMLQTRTQGPWTVIEVAGELDLHTSPALRDHVLDLIEQGARLLAIEMSKVGFVDSSTLGALITCLKRLRERDGRLALVGMGGSPMRVMNLTGLDRVFELVGSTAALPVD